MVGRARFAATSSSGDSTTSENRRARVRLVRSASKWGPNRVVKARRDTDERLTFTMNTDQLSISIGELNCNDQTKPRVTTVTYGNLR